MLKPSYYNYIWPLEDVDGTLIFNSISSASMEINNDDVFLLENKCLNLDDLNDKQKELVADLVKGGFLIEDFADELKILTYRNMNARFNKDTLGLTIIPTFYCNLKCFYCYQGTPSTEVMSEEVQNSIIEYVSKSAKGLKTVSVCWFGGEPLIAWGVIQSLTQRIMRIASEHDLKYDASMITNGTLLDDHKINELKNLGINRIQLTLDGPPKLHSKRKGIAGDPEKNFYNLIKAAEMMLGKQIKVSLRINLDKNNSESVEELLDILSELPIKEAIVHPAQVSAYSEACSNIDKLCLNDDEYHELEANFIKSLVAKGFSTDLKQFYPIRKSNFCGADQINSFTIGPNGYVYKCWNEIGTSDVMVSDLMKNQWNEQQHKRMKMRQIEWVTNSPFEIEECRECKYLPLCMGGCPRDIIKSNKPKCPSAKANLQAIITDHYYCTKIQNILKSLS